MRLCGVLTVVLAVASAACSLLTDTNGLTSVIRENADDASTASDAGERDGALDGVATDADVESSTTDTGADAPPFDANSLPDAATCPAGARVLCDGFERATLLGDWSGKTTSGGGLIDLATEGQRKFLRALSPATDNGAYVDAELYRTFGSAIATDAYYDYDLRYTNLVAANEVVEFQTIYFQKTGGYSEVFLSLTSNGPNVVEQQTSNVTVTPIAISAGIWHRISVEVHIGGALLVKVDGVTAVSKTLASFIAAGEPTIAGGITYGSRPPTALAIDVDNIVFRANP